MLNKHVVPSTFVLWCAGVSRPNVTKTSPRSLAFRCRSGLYDAGTFAPCVNKLGIEAYARVPFNRVEGNSDLSEDIVVFEPSKDAEIQSPINSS